MTHTTQKSRLNILKMGIYQGILLTMILTPQQEAFAAKKKSSTDIQQKASTEKSAEVAPEADAKGDVKADPKSETTPPANPAHSPVVAAAMRIDTQAQQAIVLDYHTGRVIYEKNADQRMHPSSMTKIMTAYMAFDRLKNNVIKPETPIFVSEKAWRMGGSRMYINVNSQVTVDELLNGIIIQSGNDACVALAEGLSGSEEVFAAEMTQKAKELGCTQTTFKNASGWPDPEHLSSARDLAIIARRTIQDFPENYDLFGRLDYTYNKIKQPNRNPLLLLSIGCDGLKTGFTDAGQYGLVASAKEITPEGHEKRFIVVVNGLPSSNIRKAESLKMLTWAMKTFATLPIAKKGQVLANMDVSAGEERTVGLTIAEDAYATFPQVAKNDVKTELVYDRSIQAPIKAGQVLGKAVITVPTFEKPIEVDLIAMKDIERAGFFKRIWNSIAHIFGGA